MPRTIVTTKAVQAFIVKQSRRRAMRLADKIQQLADTGLDGDLANNIRRLKGRDDYRLRVGDYRIVFRIDDTTLSVVEMFSRGRGY